VERTPSETLGDLYNLVAEFVRKEGLLQFGLLAGSLLIAYIIHRILFSLLVKKEASSDEKDKHRYKWLKKTLYPFILFFVILGAIPLLSVFYVDAELLRIAAPLPLSLAVVRLVVYFLRKVLQQGPLLKRFENIVSVSIFIVVALYLLGWLGPVARVLDSLAIEFGQTRFSVLSLLKLGVSVSFFLLLAVYLSGLAERKLTSSGFPLPANIRIALAKIAKLALYIFAVLIALNSVGFDLTVLTVLGGAIGVGLGFGLQRISSNYISGFILIMDRSIKPGDVISIGTQFGWVESLKSRYVVVKDRDGVETLIPNETLVTSNVVNWSYGDTKVRVKIPVQVSYSDDPKKCIEIFLSCARASKRVIDDPPPVCRLTEFGDNGVTLELRIWINDPQNGTEEVKTDIYLDLWEKFKQEKITIPFPQRDLHLKSGSWGQ